MAVILSDTAKKMILDALGDSLDGGRLEFRTAGNALVGTVVLNEDAFDPADGIGTVTIVANTSPTLTDPDCVGNANADITNCEVRQSDGTLMCTLAVGVQGSGAEIVISSVRIFEHDTLTVTSGVFSMT